MTANCTTATTSRTKTAVTVTPNTAKVDYIQNAGHITYHTATAKLDSGIAKYYLPHSPAARLAILDD